MLGRSLEGLRDALVRRAGVLVLLVGLTGLPCASALADSVLIAGINPSQTFIPFGGLTNTLRDAIDDAVANNDPEIPTPRFQQVYDASAFPQTAIEINELIFAEDGPPGFNAALLGGTTCSGIRTECGLFTITLSTTAKTINHLAQPIDALDSTDQFDTNLTPLMTAVFAQEILLSSFSAGGLLTIPGTSFLYDPLQDGNLIVDIQITEFGTSADITQGKNDLFFQATSDHQPLPLPDGSCAEPFCPYSLVDNFDGLDNKSFGLSTSITYDVVPVPEPSTGLLLGGALVGLVYRGRRAGTAVSP